MKILITGGAGFIGSNLVDRFIEQGNEVVCLDDLKTGFENNISHHFGNPNFTFINGDIRDKETCRKAVEGCNYVSHQAALGSVPRSISDPANTNSVNIDGFLNILIAARDAKVKRFVYASSSSIYGASKRLPKVEEVIGEPLSSYAVTKLVNELYANIFSKTYGMQCIGLRYFNVFGKRQDPNGPYAAVIPLWAKKLINHEQPVINGDGIYSRDFTYIENVVLANEKALFASEEQIYNGQKVYYNLEFDRHMIPLKSNDELSPVNYQEAKSSLGNKFNYFSEVFNIAYGGNTTLLQLFRTLRENLSKYDDEIKKIEPELGPVRIGDIPHSQASILKAKIIIGYEPMVNAIEGFSKVSKWYFDNLK